MRKKRYELMKKEMPIILIVDDVPKNIQVLGILLRKFECELAVAMSGEQALKTIAKVKPDLILLDIMMPGMDGHEVCRRLKKNVETKDIPVIFLSAKSEADDIITGFDLGAVDYITKPFIGSELIARVKTHLALKEMKESLEEEIGTKNKFFSIISHDLRGSFGIILSFVQLLQNNRDSLTSGETNELLDDIESTTKNTMGLLENLLEWARSQTGKIGFNPVKLELEDLVDETIRTSSDIARTKNIALSSSTDVQEIYADKNMLLLILRNLVSNAIKFTPGGGTVSVGSELSDGAVKISVADSGVGMDSKKISKLFKVDNRITTPGTNNEQGNGLGLILCKEFVSFHGGKIGIDSVPDKGTTVWFTLPLNGKSFSEN
ncbi:His Kinase A (phospho-acceptor) domain-containing protein [Mariniphaga anaerophila]|uniref:histidine kinase n=1 Tax=Mariniphaga anaerophila TaxID=1484053 RepID=A0A1M5BFE4_9BACT|nr:hybrid sensor histidine kinase/response regulator [Mariniphaga anaerophila]SHF41241.1 His Kinase A (phospho-acceptor) domain-containing protein [Mariniphaga anaerophila]